MVRDKSLGLRIVVALTLGCFVLLTQASTMQASIVSAVIPFDYTGGGGAVPANVLSGFTGFDWAPGNALSKNGNLAVQDFVTSGGTTVTPFTLYAQARLASFLGGNLPANAGEYTVVVGFQEVVLAVAAGPMGTSTAYFGLAPVQTENFIKIYHDTTPDASDLAGTGFADVGDINATLIMSATVNGLGGSGLNFFGSNPNAPFSNLDNFTGPTAPPINNYPGITTVSGIGSVTLEGVVNYYDPNYFLTSLLGSSIKLSMTEFPTNNALPFGQVDPSARFYEGGAEVLDGAGLGAGAVAGLGTTNGLLPILPDGSAGGNEFQFQTDASQTFSIIPEPASVCVWGLGLIGLLLASRVARRRAA